MSGKKVQKKKSSLFPSFNFGSDTTQYDDEFDKVSYQITKITQYFSKVVDYHSKKEKNLRENLEADNLQIITKLPDEDKILMDVSVIKQLQSIAKYIDNFIKKKSEILEKYWNEIRAPYNPSENDPFKEVIKSLTFQKDEAIYKLEILEKRNKFLIKKEQELGKKNKELENLYIKFYELEETHRVTKLKNDELYKKIDYLESLNYKLKNSNDELNKDNIRLKKSLNKCGKFMEDLNNLEEDKLYRKNKLAYVLKHPKILKKFLRYLNPQEIHILSLSSHFVRGQILHCPRLIRIINLNSAFDTKNIAYTHVRGNIQQSNI